MATEARLSVEARSTWTDNLFADDVGEVSAWSFRGSPDVELSDESGRVKWSASYSPGFEYYPDYASLNGWDHDALGDLEVRLAKTTTLRLSEHFRRYRSISQFTENIQAAGGVTSLQTVEDRTPFNNNVADVSIEHLLSPRQQIILSYTNYIFDFSSDRLTDRRNDSVELAYGYQWSPRLRLGSRASWSRSELDNQGAKRTTDFYNLALTSQYSFSANTLLALAAGPAWVSSDTPELAQSQAVNRFPVVRQGGKTFYVDPATCPQLSDGTIYAGFGCQAALTTSALANSAVIPPDDPLSVSPGGNDSLTYFARASLSHRWEHWNFDASFERRDDQTVSAAASGVANTATANLRWKPSRKWAMRWNVTYLLRESTTDSAAQVLTLRSTTVMVPVLTPFGSFSAPFQIGEVATRRAVEITRDSKVETLGAYFRLAYDWTRNVRLHGTLFWTDEKDTLGSQTLRDWDRVTAWVGLTYRFDPRTF